MIFVLCEEQFASIANSAIVGDVTAGNCRAIAAYRQIFEQRGQTITVKTTADVSVCVGRYQSQGEACIFLSFCLPSELFLDIPCPVVAIFGWPYTDLPDEPWSGNKHNDWRTLLIKTAGVITFASSSAVATCQSMGPEFNVAVLPAPIWDGYALLDSVPRSPLRSQKLQCNQLLLDSSLLDCRQEREQVLSDLFEDRLTGDAELNLDGIVYTAVIDPANKLENWQDLVSAFCWTFRENRDLTLVVLFREAEMLQAFAAILKELYDLGPFVCRVVVLAGPVTSGQYMTLIAASSFIVSSANAEAQCLPLMEFMSAGVPAIAPDHTAFADYIDPRSAFVVASSLERVPWPCDPRMVRRTFCHRINWESLQNGFLQSYDVAVNDLDRYQAMSRIAIENQSHFCSLSVLESRFAEFMGNIRHSANMVESAAGLHAIGVKQPLRSGFRLYSRFKKFFRITS